MHFAAHISVPESVENPLKYYINNISGSLNLIKALRECGINYMIFSSSAAVYGIPNEVPITEDAPINPINPYGTSKAVVERVQEMYQIAQILIMFHPVFQCCWCRY